MSETFIGVRGVNEETFRKFRALAVEKKINLGKALSLAMRKMINERKINLDPRNLLKISGIIQTKGKVRWSEEVDEILYGMKK